MRLLLLLVVVNMAAVFGFVQTLHADKRSSLIPTLRQRVSMEHKAPALLAASPAESAPPKKKGKTLEQLRDEGGRLTVNTPIGALNPFALYYGLTSIFLGIPWYFALKTCQFLYWITGNRFDPKVRQKEMNGCWIVVASDGFSFLKRYS